MKTTLKTSLLAGIASLLFLCPAWKKNELTDISKPYLGSYECTEARLGSRDCLERFIDIRLELADEENFTLFYQEKGEARKTVKGKYRYDKARSVLVVTDEKSGISREFPLEKGKITVFFPVGRKELVLQFTKQ